jgi:hypothetical protein
MTDTTATIVVNDETIEATGQLDKGSPMVWRFRDGSGDPGTPPSFAVTRVVLVRKLYPFATLMSDYLAAMDSASTVPQERINEMRQQLTEMYTRVDLTNLAENLFGLETLEERALEELNQ